MTDVSALVERGRGILTQHDREYLMGTLEDPPVGNSEHQKRFKIRQRVQDSMLDFYIIARYMSEQDLNQLWDQTDDWLHRSRRQRQIGDTPPYPELPLLAKCWRDIIAFFVYAQISTGILESEWLVEWVIEEGVNKGVRRNRLIGSQTYQETDATLDWGLGDAHQLRPYLQYVAQEMPEEDAEAKQFLLDLQQSGYLLSSHVHYLYQTYVVDH